MCERETEDWREGEGVTLGREKEGEGDLREGGDRVREGERGRGRGRERERKREQVRMSQRGNMCK
jgi:hypothetical protein